ncbi:TPA: molecular chaperone [Serratia fonticola]
MRQYALNIARALSMIVLCLASTTTSASIVISGTRVIYPSNVKEVTVKIKNVGSSPVLLQSWIDDGVTNAKPENIVVPFILTPPINRVEAGKGQTLRLSYTGTPLATNKESIFWLNVLEIPPKVAAKAGENYLQMAFRSRIKLFFRPEGLVGNANDAGNLLIWKATQGGITANNPTPYYVSLTTVTANGKEVEGQMVAPGESQKFILPNASAGSKIKFGYVNDYGAVNNTESVAH